MRRLLALPALVVFAAACSDTAQLTQPDPLDSSQISAKAAANGVKYVPFKGSFVQTILTGTPEAEEFDFDVECGPPDQELETVDKWEGTATHLGKFTGAANGCLTFATNEISAIGRFYAANGDRLNLELRGILGPFAPGEKIRWEFTVVPGGTGRFSNAHTPPGEPITGDATIPADVFDGPPVVFEPFKAKGRISSAGSSK